MASGGCRSTRGVLIGPGLRTFERMRRSFSSMVQVRTRLRTAAAAVMPRSFCCSRVRNLLLDPGSDRRRRVTVKSSIKVFGDESDMRRRQEVLEGSERVLSRQGLGIENVDRRPSRPPFSTTGTSPAGAFSKTSRNTSTLSTCRTGRTPPHILIPGAAGRNWQGPQRTATPIFKHVSASCGFVHSASLFLGPQVS